VLKSQNSGFRFEDLFNKENLDILAQGGTRDGK
jgi:hypothetical protein